MHTKLQIVFYYVTLLAYIISEIICYNIVFGVN